MDRERERVDERRRIRRVEIPSRKAAPVHQVRTKRGKLQEWSSVAVLTRKRRALASPCTTRSLTRCPCASRARPGPWRVGRLPAGRRRRGGAGRGCPAEARSAGESAHTAQQESGVTNHVEDATHRLPVAERMAHHHLADNQPRSPLAFWPIRNPSNHLVLLIAVCDVHAPPYVSLVHAVCYRPGRAAWAARAPAAGRWWARPRCRRALARASSSAPRNPARRASASLVSVAASAARASPGEAACPAGSPWRSSRGVEEEGAGAEAGMVQCPKGRVQRVGW